MLAVDRGFDSGDAAGQIADDVRIVGSEHQMIHANHVGRQPDRGAA